MASTRRFLLIILVVSFFFPLTVSPGEEGQFKRTETVVLTPADQLILKAIDKVNERLNERIDGLNERIDGLNERIDGINEHIDNLWITMLGGFLGMMAFIGAIVFWDRRTFLRRAREECRDEVAEDRKKLEAMLVAMRKLGTQFPEAREVLNNFGLL